MELILASSSPYRRELLQRFGLPFTTDAPNIDESPLGDETPRQMVLRLALGKVRAVAARHRSAVVVGSDQAAVFAGRVLGKPGSAANAVEALLGFGGHAVEFLTSLVVLRVADGHCLSHVDTTTARFRHATRQEVERYVALDQPLDCAGGIRFEGCGTLLLDAVDTEDPTAGIGLPLIKLGAMLRQMGVNPLRRGARTPLAAGLKTASSAR